MSSQNSYFRVSCAPVPHGSEVVMSSERARCAGAGAVNPRRQGAWARIPTNPRSARPSEPERGNPNEPERSDRPNEPERAGFRRNSFCSGIAQTNPAPGLSPSEPEPCASERTRAVRVRTNPARGARLERPENA
jgi:hypothetical protein